MVGSYVPALAGKLPAACIQQRRPLSSANHQLPPFHAGHRLSELCHSVLWLVVLCRHLPAACLHVTWLRDQRAVFAPTLSNLLPFRPGRDKARAAHQ